MKPVRITRRESHLAFPIKVVRIDPASGSQIASAQATGFLWAANQEWYLVTNIHCLTGWDVTHGVCLSSDAWEPTHVEWQLSTFESNEQGTTSIRRRAFRSCLSRDGEPIWFEHPDYASRVDVAVLPLVDEPNEHELAKLGAEQVASAPINSFEDFAAYEASAADEAFVLGFPHGMSAQGFPIWKRASIASEPDVDVDGLPKILIDTATRAGMSGAPVLALRRGLTMPSGKFDDSAILGDAFNMLGVYSGRLGKAEEGLQLGVVWKVRVIDEILLARVKGRWPWIPSR
jgi:hypothetical protein